VDSSILIHKTELNIDGSQYEVSVYLRSDGSHIARTVFAPGDIIINDGVSFEEVLAKHQRLLPLAVDSRQILRELRCDA
jgi:hypothetical protein